METVTCNFLTGRMPTCIRGPDPDHHNNLVMGVFYGLDPTKILTKEI